MAPFATENCHLCKMFHLFKSHCFSVIGAGFWLVLQVQALACCGFILSMFLSATLLPFLVFLLLSCNFSLRLLSAWTLLRCVLLPLRITNGSFPYCNSVCCINFHCASPCYYLHIFFLLVLQDIFCASLSFDACLLISCCNFNVVGSLAALATTLLPVYCFWRCCC